MAWLEFTGGAFRISYRFGGRKHHHALKTADRREALSTLGRFDSNVRLIEQGAIEPPPPGADLGTYIVSGGKLGNRPSQNAASNFRLSRICSTITSRHSRKG